MPTPLPFEQQQSFNEALFLEGLTKDQLVSALSIFIGERANFVPLVVNQYGVSSQPTDTGRIVVIINPANGYDVALDIF